MIGFTSNGFTEGFFVSSSDFLLAVTVLVLLNSSLILFSFSKALASSSSTILIILTSPSSFPSMSMVEDLLPMLCSEVSAEIC